VTQVERPALSLSRTVSLSVLIAIASAWAMCLTVPGLWLVFEGPETLMFSPDDSRIFGVLCIAMGNFVFMAFVADRVFPSVMRRESAWALEMFMISVMVTSGVLLMLRFVGAHTL
jgi:hypothetical protein